MYKIFYAMIMIIWVGDVLNFPQLECLDTTYPINFLGWLLILILLPSPRDYNVTHKEINNG